MASQQPLVCTSLHLPPDLRPFLRIHELSLQVFLPNLDRLRLALEAERDSNPEATEIFDETRKVLREELEKVFKVLDLAQQLAERYSKVLEALSEGKPTQRPLFYVNLGASAGRQCSEKAMQALTVFRRELESAVRRVTTTLDTKYKKGSKTPLTSTENTKSVSEILSAIDECNELLKQCHDQFANLATQTQDESSVDSNPPSEEETQVMRAKWQTFFDNIRGVWVHGFKIADEIQYPSSDNPQDASQREKPRKNVLSWRALFQRQDKRDLVSSTNVLRPPTDPEAMFVTAPSSPPELQTNTINAENLTEGPVASGNTDVPHATPSNNPPAPKIPFWRRIFRRSKGNNSTPDDQQTRSKRWCF